MVWAERNHDEKFEGRNGDEDSNGDEGGTSGLALRLIPAPGVTLPSVSFTAGAVRFNDLGEVVEILPARSEPCDTFWIQDTGDPETWIVVCLGSCPPDEGACAIEIDLTTLEISCGYLSRAVRRSASPRARHKPCRPVNWGKYDADPASAGRVPTGCSA